MLDRILATFSKSSNQELEDFEVLWRLPESDLVCMDDPVVAGRLWQPGEALAGTYLVLERHRDRIGPSYLLRHLCCGTEIRARSPLLAYASEGHTRASLIERGLQLGMAGLHPNLVATLGVWTWEDLPRILSEVPRGEPLRQLLKPGGIQNLGRLLDLGIQLCRGLDFLHQNNQAHQDLCAEVCLVDRHSTLRLDQAFPARPWADLRAIDPRLRKDRALPESVRSDLRGPVPGSPLGLAPESWAQRGPVNRQANLWALGVLLFQMVSGRPPFLPFARHSKSPVAGLKARVLAEDAPDVRDFRPDCPEGLASVVSHCLQRDPARRPESAAAVAEQLEELFRHQTGRTSPQPRFSFTHFAAQNRNNAALVALDRGRDEEARARLDDALRANPNLPEARVNRAILGWLGGEIGASEALAAVRAAAVEVPAARRAELWLLMQAGEEGEAARLLDLMEDAQHSGWLQNLRGILRMHEGSTRQAQTAFELAVAGEPALGEFHYNHALCLNRMGEKDAALQHLGRALELQDHPVARVALAVILAAQGRISEARPHLEAALEHAPDSAWVRYHLGVYHASMGLRVPGFDAAPTDLAAAEEHLAAAVARASGFYRARDALVECRRRRGLDPVLPDLYEGPPTAPELRELSALWNVSLVRVLSGHNEAVNALTMSWDGRYIISAGHDDSILVWDPLKAEVKTRLRGHAGAVRSVSVSADGSTLASGADDGTARLWQLPAGPASHILRGHEGPVTAVALSPAGSVLVTGGDDRTVRVWEARTGDLRHTLEGHQSRVAAVALSYDGEMAVSAGMDRSVLVWELVTGGLLIDMGDLGEEVYSLALSSDSRYLLTGGSSRALRLWDLETGLCLRTMEGHENEIRAVSLSPDGRFAMSGGWDRTVRLWNVATGQCIRTLTSHEHQVTAVHACADGRFGLSGSLDRTLRWWEWKQELLPLVPGRPPLLPASADRAYLEEASSLLAAELYREARASLSAGRRAEALAGLRRGQALPGRRRDPELLNLLAECAQGGRRVGLRDGWCRSVLEGHTNWVLKVAWSPDGRLLATGGLDGMVGIWSTVVAQHLGWLEGHGREVTALDFDPDGQHLLSSSYDRTMRYWHVGQGEVVRILRGHAAEITCGILSRHVPMVLSSSLDGTVRVWNVENGEPLLDLRGHEGAVFSVALSLTDRLAATGGSDRRVLLWELPSGRHLQEMRGHSGPITAMSFSPDGACLLSGSEDRRALLWEVSTGREIRALEGHEGPVRSVHFLADGRFLATAGDDGQIRIWHADGRLALVLKGHEGPVRWVRFSPDGRYLASAGNDRTARIWELDWDVELPAGD